MSKIALLVGVSEYEPGLNPLPAAVRDLDAMREVLLHPDIGGFAESDVTLLKNPNRQVMEEAIYTLFASRQRDDLLLLFFSGHGIKDDNGTLYLATRGTRKAPQGDLIRPTAVSANFVHESMSRSRSKRQIVILDSCFSGAFAEGMSAKDDGTVDIRNQLGGEGRAVLTSSSSTQYSFEEEGEELSLYSRFLIEGIKTGEADLDGDEVVSIDELHEYASRKVREVKPELNPEMYAIREGFKIRLTKVPPGDPIKKYRKEVARFINRGEISFVGRRTLDVFRTRLGLEAATAWAIEDEVLEPYRNDFRKKLQQYEQVFRELNDRKEPIKERDHADLQNLQQILGLRNEDTVPIEARVTAALKVHKQNLQAYERALVEALRQAYPLSETQQRQFHQMQQQMELTNAEVDAITVRVTADVETYHLHAQEYEQQFATAVQQQYPLSETQRLGLQFYRESLSLSEVDVAPIEAKITTEIKTYQQKVQNYKEAFIQATQSKYQPSEVIRQQLQRTWQTLGLVEADVQSIEAPILAQIEKHQANIRQYEREFTDATQQEYPLREEKRLNLQQRQQQLNLNDEDVTPIQTRITADIKEHLQKIEQYEQVLSASIQFEYPLSKPSHEEIKRFQQVLELSDTDAARIEEQILASQQIKTPVDEPVVEPPLEPESIAKPHLVKARMLVGAGIAILGLGGVTFWVMNLQAHHLEQEVPQKISTVKTTPVPTPRSPDQQAEVKPTNAKAAKVIAQLKGHKGEVTSVAFIPDSQKLATSGADGRVIIWDDKGQRLSQFMAHKNPIWSISFSPDGQKLVTAGVEGKLKVWNLKGQLLREFRASPKPIKSVQFSPTNGNLLASTGDDGYVRLWNLEGQALKEREWIADPKQVLALAFSPDGQQLATGRTDGSTELWNLKGKVLKKFGNHHSPVISVAFSPNGKKLASGCTKSMLRTFILKNYSYDKMFYFTHAAVNSVAFNTEGDRILSGDSQGNLFFWNLNTQEQFPFWRSDQKSIINKVAISPDGKRFADATVNGATLWEVK